MPVGEFAARRREALGRNQDTGVAGRARRPAAAAADQPAGVVHRGDARRTIERGATGCTGAL